MTALSCPLTTASLTVPIQFASIMPCHSSTATQQYLMNVRVGRIFASINFHLWIIYLIIIDEANIYRKMFSSYGQLCIVRTLDRCLTCLPCPVNYVLWIDSRTYNIHRIRHSHVCAVLHIWLYNFVFKCHSMRGCVRLCDRPMLWFIHYSIGHSIIENSIISRIISQLNEWKMLGK